MSALLAGVALAFAVWLAVRLAWLADDSFISFRYAWNLVHGHGLVYNAGEYVEGYTNLLWTILMAAAMGVGVVPEVSSKALGIICWLLLAAVLALRSWRHREAPVEEHRDLIPQGQLAVDADEDVPLAVRAVQ
jgi:arabinofuranosyltransferase